MAFHFTIPNASIQDTLRYILNFVNRYSTDPFVQQFAREFDTEDKIKNPYADNSIKDKSAYIKRVFDYICTNGFYELDGDGNEELWTPAKIISTRSANGKFKYDCKKITILLGSVLKAAGIDPVLKHVYYSDGAGGFKDYTHIYIIVPNPDLQHYITVDPTNGCMWNTEVQHDKATLYFLDGKKIDAPMDLHLMGNNNAKKTESNSLLQMFGESAGQVENDLKQIVGCPDKVAYNNYAKDADSIGLKNDYFSYTPAEAAAHLLKVPAFSIFRNSFLGLLYLGALLRNTPLKLNWANRLAQAWQKDKAKVRKTWWRLGGTASASALQHAIIKGSGITISGPPGHGVDYPIDLVTAWKQERAASGIGIAPAVLAAITASTPIWLELLHMLKGMAINVDPEPPVPDNTPPPTDPPPPPPPPGPGPGPGPGPAAGSFNFISDLCYGNITNALIKSVIVSTAVKMSLPGIIHFIQNFF